MIAVITGDIINSEAGDPHHWSPRLKGLLNQCGETPANWDLYRGDEFQLKCKTKEALQVCLTIKSLLRTMEGLDARLAIGIGEEDYPAARITESNGSAYVRSGRLLDELKKSGETLALSSGQSEVDRDVNMVLKWALLQFDSWTPATAEVIRKLLQQPTATQETLANALQVSQSSVSQRMKRANFDLIKQTMVYFQIKMQQL